MKDDGGGISLFPRSAWEGTCRTLCVPRMEPSIEPILLPGLAQSQDAERRHAVRDCEAASVTVNDSPALEGRGEATLCDADQSFFPARNAAQHLVSFYRRSY